MSLPIIRDGRIYSDVLVDLYSDGQIRYDRESLLERLAPLIAETARMEFEARLGPGPRISPEQVERAGVLLRYDSSLLEIHVERIDPLIAPLKQLGEAPGPAGPAITLQPASLSAYLNVSGDFRVSDFRDFEDPALLLTGAIRYGGVVLEFDGGYDPSFGRSGFYRRETRLVYDEPEHSRRWSAGDLQLPGLSVGGGALLGGVGVEKGRRNFLGAQPLTSIGSQQVLLERDATVEVFVAGQQVQTLQLAAGPYDLSQLRAEYSGRNARLFITDITGRRQLTDFDTYFNPIDLAVGEDEYSAGLGFAPRGFPTQPAYGGLPAFSGHYRRGLTNRLSLGAALQVSERIQMTGLEVVIAPRAIPGRFELSGAVSSGDGLGFAAHGGYTLQAGSGGNHQVSIVADYRSDRFATLVDEIGVPRMRTLNVSANYSRGFGDRTILVTGLNWFAREHFPTIRSAYADVIYRTSRFRLTGGVEYGTGTFGRTFGARVAITVPFGRTSRAEVGYNSRRDDFRAFMSRSSDDRVGSWGYDLGVRRTPGSATVDASGTYVGDRFFSRAVVSSGGTGFSDIGDRQQARLQVGTALAYADGAVAIGRPIQDSFVIASPSPSLEGERAVIGRSLGDNQHDATSGTLGPALAGRLTSYSRQSIVYDLAGGARGRDIGSGVETVEPPYRSGYRLIVGKGATITAAGFLNLPTGRAELVSGTITSSDDAEFGTQPFFTNSAGRFAAMGLKPGHSYQVRLFNHDWSYSMTVPERTDSLLQLGEILVVPAKDPKE